MERNYLDWGQFKYNKSRTKLIREAIRNKIEDDEEYKRYLTGKAI